MKTLLVGGFVHVTLYSQSHFFFKRNKKLSICVISFFIFDEFVGRFLSFSSFWVAFIKVFSFICSSSFYIFFCFMFYLLLFILYHFLCIFYTSAFYGFVMSFYDSVQYVFYILYKTFFATVSVVFLRFCYAFYMPDLILNAFLYSIHSVFCYSIHKHFHALMTASFQIR